MATDLEAWVCDHPERVARDVTVHGKPYRRLDPLYYAWLRKRVEALAAKYKATLLPRGPLAKYPEIRERFEGVHRWAMQHLPREPIKAALARPASYFRRYPLPRPFDGGRRLPDPDPDRNLAGPPPPDPVPAGAFAWPVDGDPRAHKYLRRVSEAAVAKVDAVADAARACGWTDEELYRNRAPCVWPFGREYGLVCHLDGDTAVAEVAADAIWLVSRHGHRTRFQPRADARRQP